LELTDWNQQQVITKNFNIYQIEPESGKLEKRQDLNAHRRNILDKCIFYISGCYERNVDYYGQDLGLVSLGERNNPQV
jgi:hypothetical protein